MPAGLERDAGVSHVGFVMVQSGQFRRTGKSEPRAITGMTDKVLDICPDGASHRIHDSRAEAGALRRCIGATSNSIVFNHEFGLVPGKPGQADTDFSGPIW